MKKIIAFLFFLTIRMYAQNLSCTGQGFDTYCGISSLSSSNPNTGYFRVERDTDIHGNKRWVMVNPLNHFYIPRTQYNMVPNINGAIFSSHYGSSSALFTTHELNRSLKYGWNGLDIYSSQYALPVTNGTGAGNAVKLPFVVFWPTANDATGAASNGNGHPSYFGWTDAGLKNICYGFDTHGYTGYCTPGNGGTLFIDPYDPRWITANTKEVQIQFTGGPPPIPSPPIYSGTNIKIEPLVLWHVLGDPDWWFPLRGNGVGNTYPHGGQMVATVAFNYNIAPVSGYSGAPFTNPWLYAKFAWSCGFTGANAGTPNPASCDGTSYLEQKYGTLVNLKASWGPCAAGYTTFGSAGGFGVGTGILDEDGRAGGCFHTIDYYNQSGLSANVIVDIDAFLQQLTVQLYGTMATAIKTTYGDTNHLLACGNMGGNNNIGLRLPVIQGMVNSGCNVIIMGWDSNNQSNAQAANQYVYDNSSLPQTIWYGTTATCDSSFGCGGGQSSQGNFNTQTLRGTAYSSDMSYLYNNSIGSNNDRYNMGSEFWDTIDVGGYNWGFISQQDNVYDGCQDTMAGCGVDQFGYPTGAEAANHTNFVGAVTTSHALIVNNLIADFNFTGSGGQKGSGLSKGSGKSKMK